MSEVTRILSAIEAGEPQAADKLLPVVYAELRRLAGQRLAHEKPGQTLEATALVHEAYLRLVASPGREAGEGVQQWNSRGHFFAAAAEAMRRILVDRARHNKAKKRGGAGQRLELPDLPMRLNDNHVDLLALDDALRIFEGQHPEKAQVVKLRFFTGCTLEETAQNLGISRATAERHWAFARAWLYGRLNPA
jgi:RNA polymerase sigma factor (TIGR02999 family)